MFGCSSVLVARLQLFQQRSALLVAERGVGGDVLRRLAQSARRHCRSPAAAPMPAQRIDLRIGQDQQQHQHRRQHEHQHPVPAAQRQRQMIARRERRWLCARASSTWRSASSSLLLDRPRAEFERGRDALVQAELHVEAPRRSQRRAPPQPDRQREQHHARAPPARR